jgi:hypothetical protein
MNIDEILDGAENRVTRETFGEGELSFTVELRCITKTDLEVMRKKAVKRVWDKASRSHKDEVDADAMRAYVRDRCINDWSGLTVAKLCGLCNKSVPGPLRDKAKDQVDFTPENADAMLKQVMGFEEWVWEKVTALADELAQIDAESKKN